MPDGVLFEMMGPLRSSPPGPHAERIREAEKSAKQITRRRIANQWNRVVLRTFSWPEGSVSAPIKIDTPCWRKTHIGKCGIRWKREVIESPLPNTPDGDFSKPCAYRIQVNIFILIKALRTLLKDLDNYVVKVLTSIKNPFLNIE